MTAATRPNWPDIADIMTFRDGDPDENPWVSGEPAREKAVILPYRQ